MCSLPSVPQQPQQVRRTPAAESAPAIPRSCRILKRKRNVPLRLRCDAQQSGKLRSRGSMRWRRWGIGAPSRPSTTICSAGALDLMQNVRTIHTTNHMPAKASSDASVALPVSRCGSATTRDRPGLSHDDALPTAVATPRRLPAVGRCGRRAGIPRHDCHRPPTIARVARAVDANLWWPPH